MWFAFWQWIQMKSELQDSWLQVSPPVDEDKWIDRKDHRRKDAILNKIPAVSKKQSPNSDKYIICLKMQSYKPKYIWEKWKLCIWLHGECVVVMLHFSAEKVVGCLALETRVGISIQFHLNIWNHFIWVWKRTSFHLWNNVMNRITAGWVRQ